MDEKVNDIAHEFNIIVDSVKDSKSDFIHDRYFRFAFSVPSCLAACILFFFFSFWVGGPPPYGGTVDAVLPPQSHAQGIP